MSLNSHRHSIFRKAWINDDPGRLLSVLKDLASRAEKRLVYYRLLVIVLNTMMYFVLPERLITLPGLAIGTLYFSWVYALILIFVQPLYRQQMRRNVQTFAPLFDGVLLTVWIAATGGFGSPFYIAYYVGVVAVAFSSSGIFVYGYSVLFSILYAGTSVYLGNFETIDLVFRCAFMVLSAAIGEMIVSESVAQAINREKYRERMQESARMHEIFKNVQEDLESAVEKRTRELAEANATLEAEINKRIETEAALKRSIEETDRANKAKSEFLANVSHEIRTPLNAVIGYSELLAEKHASSVEREIYADSVRKNGKLLGAIIGDILDLSKIENGAIAIEKASVDVRTIITDVADLFRREAEAKGLKFNVVIDPDAPAVVAADPTRLKQILVNLVGNAVKFTDSGSVSIRAESGWDRMPRTVRFVVSDTGVGIPAEKHGRIFAPFTQVDSSTSKKYGGTGLGLTISRILAQKMGGRLDLETSSVNKGAEFALTLPVEKSIGNSVRKSKELKLKSSVPGNKQLAGLRFLVVDDASDNQVLLKHLLTYSGAEVVDLAIDGVGAIRLGSSNQYDIILMDLQMPRVDGFQATEALRRLGVQTPIIAVTAHAMTEVRERAMTEGFSGFIAKPVMPGILVSTVLEVLCRNVFIPAPGSTAPAVIE